MSMPLPSFHSAFGGGDPSLPPSFAAADGPLPSPPRPDSLAGSLAGSLRRDDTSAAPRSSGTGTGTSGGSAFADETGPVGGSGISSVGGGGGGGGGSAAAPAPNLDPLPLDKFGISLDGSAYICSAGAKRARTRSVHGATYRTGTDSLLRMAGFAPGGATSSFGGGTASLAARLGVLEDDSYGPAPDAPSSGERALAQPQPAAENSFHSNALRTGAPPGNAAPIFPGPTKSDFSNLWDPTTAFESVLADSTPETLAASALASQAGSAMATQAASGMGSQGANALASHHSLGIPASVPYTPSGAPALSLAPGGLGAGGMQAGSLPANALHGSPLAGGSLPAGPMVTNGLQTGALHAGALGSAALTSSALPTGVLPPGALYTGALPNGGLSTPCVPTGAFPGPSGAPGARVKQELSAVDGRELPAAGGRIAKRAPARPSASGGEQCGECGLILRTRAILHNHMRVVHKSSSEHRCPECDAEFPWKSTLGNHIRLVHRKERPYSCRLCDKAFRWSSHLEEHVWVTHEKRKPFKCPVCQKDFGRKNNMQKHIRKVHQANPAAAAAAAAAKAPR